MMNTRVSAEAAEAATRIALARSADKIHRMPCTGKNGRGNCLPHRYPRQTLRMINHAPGRGGGEIRQNGPITPLTRQTSAVPWCGPMNSLLAICSICRVLLASDSLAEAVFSRLSRALDYLAATGRIPYAIAPLPHVDPREAAVRADRSARMSACMSAARRSTTSPTSAMRGR